VSRRSRKTNLALMLPGPGPGRSGTAAIELLLVLPLLLLIILAMVQIGMLLAAQQELQLASREGARVAALGGSQADVERAARLVLGQGTLSQAVVASALTDGNGNPLPSGAAVVVVVSVSTQTAVPNFVKWSGVVLAGETISGRTVLRKE
jgi:Flp pilus assembly protein TadG